MSFHLESSLAIPASVRATCSNDICGVATNHSGCNRFAAGLKPYVEPVPELDNTVDFWVVWNIMAVPDRSTPDSWRVEADSYPAAPKTPKKNFHELRFALSSSDSKKNSPFPCFVSAYEWEDSSETHRPLCSWMELERTFGAELFSPFRISGLPSPKSIADLLDEYLDDRCPFRSSSSSRHIGLARCFVDWYGRLEWHHTELYFFLLDPSSFRLELYPHLSYASSPDTTAVLKAVQSEIASPPESRARSYADYLYSVGRSNLLPQESGQSYLLFAAGEIASYVTYWLLVRCLCDSSPAGDEFRSRIRDWLSASSKFETIFNMPVRPVRDPSVHLYIDMDQDESRLGLTQEPKPFGALVRSLLATSMGECLTSLAAAIDFLTTTFWEDNRDRRRRLASLPMYRSLGWRPHKGLEAGYRLGDDCRQVEALCKTFLEGADYLLSPDEAGKSLGRMAETRVIPLTSTLALWPRGNTDLAVIPVWEAELQNTLRPVIFAHLFIGRRQPWTGTLEAIRSSRAAVTRHQGLLLGAGRTISHEYYERLLVRYRDMTEARHVAFFAHEINSLLNKQFVHIRASLSAEQRFAWDTVSATAEIAHMRTKLDLRSGTEHDLLNEYFLSPLRDLRQEGKLIEAVFSVARSVYQASRDLQARSRLRRRRGLETPPIAEFEKKRSQSDPKLNPEQFAACFLLVGEMIRNYCAHSEADPEGRGGVFSPSYTANQLTVTLTQISSGSLPGSETFASLGHLLAVLDVGNAKVSWVRRPLLIWVVEVALGDSFQFLK